MHALHEFVLDGNFESYMRICKQQHALIAGLIKWTNLELAKAKLASSSNCKYGVVSELERIDFCENEGQRRLFAKAKACLLYTSDAADE